MCISAFHVFTQAQLREKLVSLECEIMAQQAELYILRQNNVARVACPEARLSCELLSLELFIDLAADLLLHAQYDIQLAQEVLTRIEKGELT